MLLFWRTLLSGLILLPFALAFGPKMQASAVLYQMGFGVMAVFLYLGGFSVAIEQRVPTGLVALIADLLPLAIAVLSQPMLGERLSSRQWLGTGIAIAGVLLVTMDSLSIGNAPLWAYALTVGSMLIFALASVLHRGQKRHVMPVYQSLCIHSLTGAVLFGICSWGLGDGLMPPLTRGFAIGMVWLILLGTFVSYFVYYIALRLYPAAKVSAAIYLAPPVTMIWAWVLFDDPLTPIMFVGLAITLVGVFLTTTNAKPREEIAANGKFVTANPSVDLLALSTVAKTGFGQEDADVAIRWGPGGFSDGFEERLFGEKHILVASAQTAKMLGEITDLNSLADRPFLHDTNYSEWRRVIEINGADPAAFEHGIYFGDSSATVNAILHSQGIGVVRDVIARHLLDAGALVQLPFEPVDGPFSYYFICPERRVDQPRVQAFLNWLRGEAQNP